MIPGKLGRYARSVSIIGIGATPFCDISEDPELKGLTEGEFFGHAALMAMEDAGLEPRDVDYFYHGSANPKFFNFAATPNMQVAEWFGMRGKGSIHHSEACCTGYAGLEEAVKDVASGAHDIVLSGCVEMSCGLPVPGQPAHLRRGITTDDVIPDLEAIMDRAYTRALGGGHIGQDDWMDLYKQQYGLTDEQVDEVLNTMSYHGRRAAAVNPLAMLRTPFEELARESGFEDPMEYLRSAHNPKSTQYLRITGTAASADGAACVIVCPTEMAHQFKQKPVEVLGIGASCLELMRPHNEMEITKEAARQVYEMTGLSPADIDLLLVNDFVLASQLCAAEEVGYLPRGEGWKWVLEGRTAFDGDRPINPHGGRTSYGHAYGASGMADVYEAVLQLRGQAGAHQVKNQPRTAMLRGFGGGQNCRIPILRTVE
ncbi:MAG: thiolase family protein [Lachnospiraceae bacterium]|nr:thiolase family protein [Lachnospiraceae bacterium]MCI9150186.1 thiolase family protein [Lachnospiraceae bacterium]